MEESVKRRERLKVMRLEANQAEASPNFDTSPLLSTPLSNPLAEPSSPAQDTSPAQQPRFDFYTDPMAAFSGQKRKVNNLHQNSPNYNTGSPLSRPPALSSLQGPGNLDNSPSSHQFQNNYSPDQRLYEGPPPYHGPSRMAGLFPENQGAPQAASGPFWGPQGTPPRAWNGPFPGPQGAPPRVWNNNPFPGSQGTPPGVRNSSFPVHQGTPPGVRNGPFPGHQGTPPGVRNSPFPGHQGTPPGVRSSPFPGHQGTPPGVRSSPFLGHQGTPGAWNSSGGTTGYGYPSNSSRGGDSSGSSFGRGGSPSPNSGRGSGHQYNTSSPGSGWGGGRGQGRGRGRGFHGSASARERPDLFYSKSMVEDPWKFLKPIVRQLDELKTPDSLKSWLPKSITMKKDKEPASSGTSREFGSGPRESLAASFEKAAGDGRMYELFCEGTEE